MSTPEGAASFRARRAIALGKSLTDSPPFAGRPPCPGVRPTSRRLHRREYLGRGMDMAFKRSNSLIALGALLCAAQFAVAGPAAAAPAAADTAAAATCAQLHDRVCF